MAGFEYVKSLGGETDIYLKLPAAVSTAFTKGDRLKFTNGKLAKAGATDKSPFVAAETKTTSSTEHYMLTVIRTANLVFKNNHTPLVNAVAAQANTDKTKVKVALTDGSSSDLVGFIVYCPELDEWHVVTANTYSSNVVTITVAENFSRAVTTGDTVVVFSFGFGSTTIQGDATNPESKISAVRGETSGYIQVYDIKPKTKEVQVLFTQ